MPVGLSTPLHLAASLLAVAAAGGLAVMAFAASRGGSGRPTQQRADTWAGRWSAQAGGPLTLLTGLGALALAASHVLAGALVPGTSAILGWLRAAGLVAIAIGITPSWLGAPLATPAIILPVGSASAAAVSLAAGGLAGARALLGGRRTVLLGAGLLAWGAAEAVAQRSVTSSSVVTLLGSVLVGTWIWQVSVHRIQARFVSGFVTSLLAVVVLLTVVLGTVSSADLASEELDRLEDFSGRLADTISVAWPQEALQLTGLLRRTGSTLLGVQPDDRVGLRQVLGLLSGQDFFVLLDAEGRTVSAFSEVPELRQEAFVRSVAGSRPVDRLLAGNPQDGGSLSVGGRMVAIGGAPLLTDDARAEDPPLGILIAGRVADDVWASQEATELGVDLVLTVGGELSAASPFVDAPGPARFADVAVPADRAAIDVDGRAFFVAASPILDGDTGEELGRLVVVRPADVIAGLERDEARRLFLLALLGALLAGMAAAVLTGRLVAPIRRLTVAAAAVREGDLSVEPRVETPDEVGQLGRTFTEMTRSLGAQSAQLREAAEVEARLRARLEALTESMGDALVAVDADGKVVTFNPSAERLVGRDVAEVLGLPLEEVLTGRGPSDTAILDAVGPADSTATRTVQLLLERADGRLVPAAATAAPVREGDGPVLGRVLVLRDVTRESEVERMKTEFLSNVSHELRTPLTPIKGYAEVLARRDVGPDATRRFADQILASTSRLERIVGMIVDFAALDSGRLTLRREPTDLRDLVGEFLQDWRHRQPARDFRRRVARDLPGVMVDPAMLRRCLDELLDNAVKFSPGGEPISLAAIVEQAPPEGHQGPMVRLSIRDRGVGIEPDTAAGVFSDFYQADASETRHFGGLGLGLALVRRIVDGLDGAASVDSEPGVGTTVHLWLPVADTHGSGRSPVRRWQSTRREG